MITTVQCAPCGNIPFAMQHAWLVSVKPSRTEDHESRNWKNHWNKVSKQVGPGKESWKTIHRIEDGSLGTKHWGSLEKSDISAIGEGSWVGSWLTWIGQLRNCDFLSLTLCFLSNMGTDTCLPLSQKSYCPEFVHISYGQMGWYFFFNLGICRMGNLWTWSNIDDHMIILK